MTQTLYVNKCKTCGTTIVLTKKMNLCEACGSDNIAHSKYGEKEIDILGICKTAILILLAAGLTIGFICMVF